MAEEYDETRSDSSEKESFEPTRPPEQRWYEEWEVPLTPLEFTYSGVPGASPGWAIYEDPQGFEFRFEIGGAEPESVKEVGENLWVYLELFPVDEPEPTQQDASQEEDPSQIDKELQEMPPAVELAVELVEDQGIEPPYQVHFVIDPPISVTTKGPHVHKYTATSIDVNITANNGSQHNAKLLRGWTLMCGPVTVVEPPQGGIPQTSPNMTGAASNKKTFRVAVTGSGGYTLSGEYTT